MGDSVQNRIDDLIVFLKSLKGKAASNLDAQTPLFSSGLIDSLVLLQLSMWIEEKVGGPINPAEFNLADEWATVAGVADFVERMRALRNSNG